MPCRTRSCCAGPGAGWPPGPATPAGLEWSSRRSRPGWRTGVRGRLDTITSPRASHALLRGRLNEREAFVLATAAFAVAAGIGVALIVARGWWVAGFGTAGLIGGWGYTAPPLQYKYRALGLPLVFMLMGPLMVIGSYYVVAGGFSWGAVAISVPVGLLVAAILHGNEWRDISEDARAGIATFSI